MALKEETVRAYPCEIKNKVLERFLKAIEADHRVNPRHISVFVTLWGLWAETGEVNQPVSFKSREIMQLAKISSSKTWHIHIRDLDSFGYLKYRPMFNRFKKSEVILWGVV